MGLGKVVRRIGRDGVALWLAAVDRRTPWRARLLTLAVTAYALSPVDLISDVIPGLGLLDDVAIVPLGIWLATKCVPDAVLADSRRRAASLWRKPAAIFSALLLACAVIVLAVHYWSGGAPQ